MRQAIRRCLTSGIGFCLLFVRHFAKRQVYGLEPAILQERELDGGIRRHHPDLAGKIACVLHRRAVDRGDHVARAAGLRLIDDCAFNRFQAEAIGDVGRDRLNLHAQPGAVDVAVLFELGHDRLRGISRNVEADPDRPARRRIDGGVYADHVAVHIERWAAGVALVDGGIDLDVVVIGAGADVAPACRDDACGDGAAETEWIADRNDPIADAGVMIGELHIREGFVGIDLDQGKIGLRIGTNDLGLVDGAVVGGNLHSLGMIDDVIIGHRIAIR